MAELQRRAVADRKGDSNYCSMERLALTVRELVYHIFFKVVNFRLILCRRPSSLGFSPMKKHHEANILSAVLGKKGDLLTGSADKTLQIVGLENLPHAPIVKADSKRTIQRAAPVLCVAVNRSGTLAVCGCTRRGGE